MAIGKSSKPASGAKSGAPSTPSMKAAPGKGATVGKSASPKK